MKLKEVHLGISYLEDETKVLTPYGLVGPVYSFSDSLYRKFSATMRVIIAFLFNLGIYLLFLTMKQGTDFSIITETAVLGAITIDLIRVVVTFIIFIGHDKISVRPKYDLSKIVRAYLKFKWPILLVGCTIYEVISFSAISLDIIKNNDHYHQYRGLLPLLLFTHIGIYLSFLMKSRMRR